MDDSRLSQESILLQINFAAKNLACQKVNQKLKNKKREEKLQKRSFSIFKKAETTPKSSG